MDLELDTMLALARACAPNVAPATLVAVAHTESRFNPFAIGVNGPTPRSLYPATAEAAARTAAALIAEGRSVDLGLGQINSANLAWLNLSVADAFDPCKNLAASARVLSAGYRPVDATPEARQSALRIAFSLYNTGDPSRGFRNGYVAKVERSADLLAPRMPADAVTADLAGAAPVPIGAITLTAEIEPPSWDVFGRASRSPLFIFTASRSQAAP
ncbi:lytic transglycosylase domain-containing protein (plasmid) [Brevundimonas staleyi]|uniref:Lytic transglycosylase domain-containing protein n=1 Tax=Brevundimonas staleyi TaxID=74326 RepID=A0ABW0FM90_9CAUL